MKQKFNGIYVAVDKKRVEGIERLMTDKDTADTDVVLLDDAYQHRYVKPGINILLVDYHKLIIYDELLPAGRLREPEREKRRADIIIITKCPKDLNPIDFRVLQKAMDVKAFQQLYFTTLSYGKLEPIFADKPHLHPEEARGKHILLLTGIAAPEHLQRDIQEFTRGTMPEALAFPDHHNFNRHDVETINSRFAQLPEPKMIITTEKDKARLIGLEGLSAEVKENIYALPIKVEFLLDGEKAFNDKITSYVHKNSRNSILAKKQNDNKSKDRHYPGNGAGTISFRDNG